MKSNRRPTGILAYGLQIVSELAGKALKREPTLDDVKLTDLQKKKMQLTSKQADYLDQVKELERKKKEYFSEGVKGGGGNEEIKVLARQIKNLDNRAKSIKNLLVRISLEITATEALIGIKEINEMNKDLRRSSVLGEMDMVDLIPLIEDAVSQGQVDQQVLADVIEKIDRAQTFGAFAKDEKEIDTIAKEMMEGRDFADDPGKLEDYYKDFDKKLTANKESEDSNAGA